LVCALLGVAGCSAVKGIAGDMGVPVRSIDRANELGAIESAKNAKLDPGSYVFVGKDGTPKTSFKLGEPVTGNLQATASPQQWYRKYTGDLQAQHGDVDAHLWVDAQSIAIGRLQLDIDGWSSPTNISVDLWTGDDSQMPLSEKFSRAGGWLEESLYALAADQLPNGSHEVRFELYLGASHPDAADKPPIAAGSYTLVVDDAGRKALARQTKRSPPKASKEFAAENKRVYDIVNALAEDVGAKVYVARSTSIWAVERDVFQQPIRRRIYSDVVFQKDGACSYRHNADFCQDHMGGGNYGDMYYCDQFSLFKGTPGAGLFAIPCGAASKMK